MKKRKPVAETITANDVAARLAKELVMDTDAPVCVGSWTNLKSNKKLAKDLKRIGFMNWGELLVTMQQCLEEAQCTCDPIIAFTVTNTVHSRLLHRPGCKAGTHKDRYGKKGRKVVGSA